MNWVLLLAKIILLIAEGLSAVEAVDRVASKSGVDFSKLWDRLPGEYK